MSDDGPISYDWEEAWAKAEKPAPPVNGAVHHIDPARLGRYAAKALAAEASTVAAAEEGTRNDTLNIAAYNLGQLVGAGQLTEDDVRHTLTDAARTCGLDHSETQATISSGIGAGLLEPRVIPEQTPIQIAPPVTTLITPEPVPPTEDEAAAISAAIRERVPLLDWHQLWDTEDVEEWIVEPILPARRLVALFSAPKVGKSLLMLELAVAISRGTPVLGTRIDTPHRVLYVDFENDPRGDIRERLQSMGHAPDDLGDLCYLSYPRLAKLDTIAGGAELMAVAAEYQCTVIVIDTISRAVAGEENDNDTWLSFYRNTGMLLKAAGIACVRLDHTGKDHDRGMRGGSAKYGDVDAVWKLSKVTEETYRLDCDDHRMPIAEKTIVVKRLPTPHLHHQVQAEGRAAAFNAQVEVAVKALDAIKAPNDAGRDTARALLRETGNTAANAALSEAVRQRKLRLGRIP